MNVSEQMSIEHGSGGVDRLFEAIRLHQSSRIALALRNMPDFQVDAVAGWRFTPLMWAARCCNTEAAVALLALGASLDVRNHLNETALTLSASIAGACEMIDILSDCGADIDAQGELSRTSLMNAAAAGVVDNVTALIRRGADLNLMDADGQTALALAIIFDQVEVVQTLVRAGANQVGRDRRGRSVHDHATHHAGSRVLAILSRSENK